MDPPPKKMEHERIATLSQIQDYGRDKEGKNREGLYGNRERRGDTGKIKENPIASLTGTLNEFIIDFCD